MAVAKMQLCSDAVQVDDVEMGWMAMSEYLFPPCVALV